MTAQFPMQMMAADPELFKPETPYEALAGVFHGLSLEAARSLGEALGFRDRRIGIWGLGKVAEPLVALYLMFGAKVMISRRNVPELDKFRQALGKHIDVSMLDCYGCDVTNPEQVRTSVAHVVGQWQGLDTVLCFAGGVN